MISVYSTAHAIFTQYWPEAIAKSPDAGADDIAERIIALADDDQGRIFNSGDLSSDDYSILHSILSTRAADLAKPIVGWTFVMASQSLCQDQDAEDNRDSILSQAWQCWRTRDAAAKAAEENLQELIEEYMVEENETMPAPDWQPHGLEGAIIWNVDGNRVIEVHPLRMQD